VPRRAPWWKLDARWFLTDPGVAVLNTAGTAALIRLLSWAWGDGSKPPLLPGDEEHLARMAKLSPAEWDTCKADLWPLMETDQVSMCYYFPVQMDQWREMQGKYELRAAAGSAGGKAKAAHAKKPGTALAAPEKADPVWDLIRVAYPTRRGAQGWREARIRYDRAVRSGTDPQTILAGVTAYRQYIATTGKFGTEYVSSAEVFFGPKRRWEEDWRVTPLTAGPVARPATKAAAQHDRLRGLRDE
jgi:hypothetical protein